MELDPKYKLTEVGVIPKSWDVKPVTEVTSEIFLGLTSKVDYVSHGGVPLIRATDIAGGRLTFNAARSISHKQHSALTKYRRAKRGDVLVSKSGSLGVCAIVDIDTEFSIYESIIVLQPKHCLDSRFLLSLLRHEATQNRMIGDRVGSTVGHLNLEVFRSLLVPLPPLPEQRSIATTLSDMDELLGALDRLIAKKRDLKQAAMQQLLTGKKRLPGFGEGKDYKETEVGIIPEDWDVGYLGDIFRLENGFSFKSEYFSSVGPIVLTPGNFKLEGGLYFNDRNTKRYSGRFPESTVFKHGDLLVVMTDLTPDCNLLGKPAFVNAEEKVLHNQRIGKIRLLSNNFDEQFLYFVLLSAPYLKQIKDQATGSTVRHTSNKSIYSVSLPMPRQLEEQRSIATVLSDMDTEIAALEQRRDKTRALKQAMMQELLTGRIRLV
jgi:type I restriction enzyme S subunit